MQYIEWKAEYTRLFQCQKRTTALDQRKKKLLGTLGDCDDDQGIGRMECCQILSGEGSLIVE